MVFIASNSIYSQILYFKLEDGRKNAEQDSGQLIFQQNDLDALLKGYTVKPVLIDPLKYHSVYADRLALTYTIDLNGYEEGLINSFRS